ncbi:MAG: hypothetical protein ACOCTR_05365, partial [Candidatus Natronoplasma sp.]
MENAEIKSVEDVEKNVLLIACYDKPYSEDSLKMIKGTIERKKPTKIIVLKIIEKPEIPDFTEARIGKKTKEDFLDSVTDDKKSQVDDYTEDILEITDKTGIPTEVRFRKAEIIADEIIKDYEKMEVDHLIIHKGE